MAIGAYSKHIISAQSKAVSNGCVFHPGSHLRVAFDSIMAVLILYTMIEVPFRIGFSQVLTLRGGLSIGVW